MRTLLFLNYWSLHEPLTQATVLPTLTMVLDDGFADRVVLVTVERGDDPSPEGAWPSSGIIHVPVQASKVRPRPLARALDLLRITGRVARAAQEHGAAFIMARGVVAGGIAHKVHQRTGLHYAVDYFEPHADYMVDAGEWRRGGWLARGLERLIAAQLRTADFRIAVSQNYRRMLMASGADGDRILVAPCPVDAAQMRFDPTARQALRADLDWGDALIGIYVGKFGGLYHKEQAWRNFAEAQRIIGPRFGLIILTPSPRDEVITGLRSAGFKGDHFVVQYAQHAEVPRFLSAADFAFAPYRGTPSSACISPMKIGEYWANGLPVILTRGVGDDSGIMGTEPYAGALYDPEGDDLEAAVRNILATIQEPGQRIATVALAGRHRSMDLTRQAYRRVFSEAWGQGGQAAMP